MTENFYHGKPCKNCGGTKRYRVSGSCVECIKSNAKRRQKLDPQSYRDASNRWKDRNREHTREYARQWGNNNPERKKAGFRNWLKANPEKSKARSHRRRALKKGNGGDYTTGEWQSLCDLYDNCCLKCGRSDVVLTVDHIIPLTKGGTNNIDNIQPLCYSCNSSKGAKTIDYRSKPGILRWIQKKLF